MCYLDVAVEDFEIVELLESVDKSDEDTPDSGLWNEGISLLLVGDFSCEVAVGCKFHHNAVCIPKGGTKGTCWPRR